MNCQCRAIVLSCIKYTDNSIIATLFTESTGKKSFIVKNVYSKKSTYKINYFQPGSILTINFTLKENKNLHLLNNINVIDSTLYIGMSDRQYLAFFLTEFVNRLLIDNYENKELYYLMEEAFQRIIKDETFHIKEINHLLIQSLEYLGISPINNFDERDFQYLSIPDAEFTSHFRTDKQILSADISFIWSKYLTYPMDTNELNLSYDTLKLLRTIIEYYKVHTGQSFALKSFSALEDLNLNA